MAQTLVLAARAVLALQELLHIKVNMDRYAIIENGLVVNVVIGQPELAPNQILVECEYGGIGWIYADGVFTAPVVVEPIVVAPTKEELLAQLQALTAQIQALN